MTKNSGFVQSNLVIIYKQFLNIILNVVRFIIFRRHSNPKKVLIFRTGSIGDAICSFPALSNIKSNFINSEIHLLTNAGKGYKSLVSIEKLIDKDFFDKIINYESLELRDLTITLKNEAYDLIIQLPQYNASFYRQIRDILYFRLIIGIPCGFGWKMDGVFIFRKSQEKFIDQINERDRINNILKSNGLVINPVDAFPFEITDFDTKLVNSQYSLAGMNPERLNIGIVVGAKRPQNRWPIMYFMQVVEYLNQKYNIVFIGGPEDKELVKPLLSLNNTYTFCGELTPIQSGLMMQNCALILSNDTGPMHLAYSFGVPVLALFSNRDFPNRWYPPLNGINKVIRAESVPCSVCFSEVCDNNICMQKITPEDVIEVLEEMLLSIEVNSNKSNSY